MERTERREEFFGYARRDPYQAVVQKMWGDAYAAGYEQALRDVDMNELAPDGEGVAAGLLYEKSHSDRAEEGLAWLTDEKHQRAAEAVVAIGSLGRMSDIRTGEE